jgi:hypothetical protein
MNKTKAMRAHARISTVSRTVEMPMHRQAIFAGTGLLLANQFLPIGRSAAHDIASLPGQMGQASGEGEASGSKQTVGRNSTNTNRSLIDVARRNGDWEFPRAPRDARTQTGETGNPSVELCAGHVVGFISGRRDFDAAERVVRLYRQGFSNKEAVRSVERLSRLLSKRTFDQETHAPQQSSAI